MIILIGNITKTLKAKNLLYKSNILSVPVQTTKNPLKPDCGHGLKINKEDFENVKHILTEAEIKIKGVYNE